MANISKIRLSGTTYNIVDDSAVHSLEGYALEANVQTAITAATDALAQSIAAQGYQTASDVQDAITGKADTTYVNQIASQATDAITALTKTVSNNYNELTGQTSDLYVYKFGDARYDSATHRINFYAHVNSPDVLAYVDASAFIKDGMVSNVEISNGNLVITFNSDAGKQPISIPLTSIFDPSNYYTTAQTQSYVTGYTYDKATIDQKVAEGGTFDPTLYYNKTETDNLLAAKADTATTYTKTEVDSALGGKQETLVSGTNIKTVGTQSLLGSGNIAVMTAHIGTGVDAETLIFDFA